ncbi:hypothetical protein AAFF_G00232420 [Aldrovandia affinis]|uniref:Uncharacterized protein n=1 Tax=Aldrovandia affinis TaxID=143900 RepID=A0AAD7W4H2_9TELE|nr:hypothetical protein AAFF_G00232420 [Aldrovandia affinis]
MPSRRLLIDPESTPTRWMCLAEAAQRPAFGLWSGGAGGGGGGETQTSLRHCQCGAGGHLLGPGMLIQRPWSSLRAQTLYRNTCHLSQNRRPLLPPCWK